MKKFAKMSLVAAVAVAGLSNVNAASLEEAIKGVDVSGQFRYRFNEHSDAGATSSDVEVEVTAKVPVNDMVTAVFKIDSNPNDPVDGSDTQLDVEQYYFQYANGPVTVLAGQQEIPGRMTDGAAGAGLVALYNAGAFTVGAAAYDTNNVNGGLTNLLTSVIAMGSVGPVSLLGQYADVEDIGDAYNLKADANIGPVTAGLEYTEFEADKALGLGTASDDRSTFKAYVSGKMDIVSAKLTYAKTGDNGSGSIDNQLLKDSTETPAEFLLWNLHTAQQKKMDLFAIDASVAVTDKISLRAAYAAGEIDDGTAAGNDVEEILGQISYKMSSNLTTYVRYAEYDMSSVNDTDMQRGRIEVKYSF